MSTLKTINVIHPSGSTNNLVFGSSGQIGVNGGTYGTSGQVLTSGGSGAAPSWATPAGITITSKTATTSGTSVLTTGIPSGVKRVVIGTVGISVSGSSHMLIQLGTSGGVQSSGYTGTALRFNNGGTGWSNLSAGFAATQDIANGSHSGNVLLQLVDVATNTWTCSLMLGNSASTQILYSAGYVSLSGTLDRINFTTVNGTDTYDAGYYTITYES